MPTPSQLLGEGQFEQPPFATGLPVWGTAPYALQGQDCTALWMQQVTRGLEAEGKKVGPSACLYWQRADRPKETQKMEEQGIEPWAFRRRDNAKRTRYRWRRGRAGRWEMEGGEEG